MEGLVSDWRETVLSLLLQRVSSSARARAPPEFDGALSPAAAAHRVLLSDVGGVAALSALAPRAADGAVALLDGAAACVPRADLFDDDARPRERPRLLGRAVAVVFAETDGRCVVRVRSTGPVSRQSGSAPGHIVLISGVCLEQDPTAAPGEMLLCIGPSDDDDAAGGRPYYHCTCRAFEFKHAGEVFCKHIFAAGVAIATNLAAYSFTSDENVVAMLAPRAPDASP